MIAFPGQASDFADGTAQRLLKDFSASIFTSDRGEPFTVTFTAGTSCFPDDGSTLAAVLRRADERLYLGKRSGRRQVYSAARQRPDSSPAGLEPIVPPGTDRSVHPDWRRP